MVLPVFGWVWNLVCREEHRLCLRIHGPEEVTGHWRKQHNEEFHDLYSPPNIIMVIKSRRMRWAGHAARIGELRNAHKVLVWNLKGKIPLGRPSCRWENIKVDIKRNKVGWCELNSSTSGRGLAAGCYEHYNELQNSIKSGNFLMRWVTYEVEYQHCNSRTTHFSLVTRLRRSGDLPPSSIYAQDQLQMN
jgi:hypothetical protein